jgi:VWFA-related protein
MTLSLRLFVPVVSAVVAGAAVLVAQDQPTFKSGARTVAIYATVTDKDGRLVPDLTRDDFEVLEDGRARPLTIFTSEIQPISLVMMLDKSGSMRGNYGFVQVAAETFVRRLLPSDRARVGTFAEKIHLAPEAFTSDKDELATILRSEREAAGPTPLWNAVNEAMTALNRQDGRRVVLVFSDGRDAPMNFKFNNMSVMDVMDRGQREDVMVYAIGLAGRDSMTMPGRGGSGGFGGGFGGGNAGPDPGLATIAAETGGGYFELTRADDLASTFTRVAEELHRQYAMGFEPTKLDGKRHKVEVKVKRPGMKVRARKNYVAAKES